MSNSVEMPALGESVTEGTVTRWLKQVGDTVEVDEPLLEVSTDKVDTEIPSPFAGVLQEILVDEDETVEVGAALARIGQAAESGASGDSDGQQAQAQAEPEQQAQPHDEQPQQAESQPQEQAQAEPQEQAQPEQPQQEQPQAGQDGGGGGTPVTMPALGESVTEGTVTRWLKQEGDTVEVDEPLLEVSTDKVDTEIPSPVAGTVQKILVDEDETVEVGAQLAIVGSGAAQPQAQPQQQPAPQQEQQAPEAKQEQPEDRDAAAGSLADEVTEREAAAEQSQQQPQAQAQAQPQAQAQVQPQAQPQAPAEPQAQPQPAARTGGDTSVYVTPLVRKLAAEHDVDLSSLEGTGVGGRIRKQDVLEAAERAKQQAAPAAAPRQAAAAPAAGGDAMAAVAAKRGTTEKMSRLRKVIAQRMVESLHTSAQLTTVVEVDVTKIARLRERAKRDFESREGVRLSYLPFFALATVEALKAHPNVNASIEDDQVVFHAQENLGVAVDTERGLLVPVIRDAGDLNIAGLARKIADLAERTRANKVTPDELGGGTFTLTNTGSRGALFDTPIINQPQVGILGTGSVVRRPIVVTDVDGGETIAIRSMVYLALTYDHRLVDGADAARFLTSVKERLEEGAFEADLGL
jgi:2-oxoglutarate dehydrogenase E2 component (dihydrolipoamide succinyltransferase)